MRWVRVLRWAAASAGLGLLHLVLQPLTLLRAGNVHELGGDGAAIEGPGVHGGCVVFFCVGNVDREGLAGEILAEWVEGGLEIAPAAVDLEDGLAAFLLLAALVLC